MVVIDDDAHVSTLLCIEQVSSRQVMPRDAAGAVLCLLGTMAEHGRPRPMCASWCTAHACCSAGQGPPMKPIPTLTGSL